MMLLRQNYGEEVSDMSMELNAVIDNFVQLLLSDPKRSREEIAALLNGWEEQGFINRQMRVVIIQRLKQSWVEKESSAQESSSNG
jgi:hypothetical protein